MVNINIPLPVSCASCPLSVRHFGKLYCPPLNDRVGNEGKDSRCPLVDAEGGGDLISRADALSCFHDWVDQRGDVHTADEMPEYQRIKQLQSAQPETNCSEFPNNSGTISRRAAIDALDKRFASIPMEQTTEILMLRKDLRELPTAQPEVIHCRECEYGEKDDDGRYFCRDLCCQMGDVWGNGFCSDAERRTDETD